MKKLFIGIMMLCWLLSLAGAAFAEQIIVYINGDHLCLPLEPLIEQGSALVPMRSIFEALGARVTWHDFYKEAEVQKGDINIKLPIGKKAAIKNGCVVELQAAAKIVKGYTLVPLRFVSEALGAVVDWDETAKIITINTAENEAAGEEPEHAWSTVELAKQAKYVVLIEIYDRQGSLAATASGVVAGPGGLVATNYHAAEGAGSIIIKNDQGESFKALGAVAFSQLRDLVLLKIEQDLPFAELGDSRGIKIGDQVLSIGSPLGIKNTVANGVVSNLVAIENQAFIQTTAPLSAGSSGGALFDSQGKLIGITTASISKGQGLNLAIPINDLKPLIENLTEEIIGFDLLGPTGRPGWAIASTEELVSYLRQKHSVSWEGANLVRFNFYEAAGNSYDYEADAIIEPDDYGGWLEMGDRERLGIVGCIVKDVDGNVDLAKSFRLNFFYQDIWPYYPGSFEENEVTPASNGKGWIITHMIGKGFTLGKELKWEVYY